MDLTDNENSSIDQDVNSLVEVADDNSSINKPMTRSRKAALDCNYYLSKHKNDTQTSPVSKRVRKKKFTGKDNNSYNNNIPSINSTHINHSNSNHGNDKSSSSNKNNLDTPTSYLSNIPPCIPVQIIERNENFIIVKFEWKNRVLFGTLLDSSKFGWTKNSILEDANVININSTEVKNQTDESERNSPSSNASFTYIDNAIASTRMKEYMDNNLNEEFICKHPKCGRKFKNNGGLVNHQRLLNHKAFENLLQECTILLPNEEVDKNNLSSVGNSEMIKEKKLFIDNLDFSKQIISNPKESNTNDSNLPTSKTNFINEKNLSDYGTQSVSSTSNISCTVSMKSQNSNFINLNQQQQFFYPSVNHNDRSLYNQPSFPAPSNKSSSFSNEERNISSNNSLRYFHPGQSVSVNNDYITPNNIHMNRNPNQMTPHVNTSLKYSTNYSSNDRSVGSNYRYNVNSNIGCNDRQNSYNDKSPFQSSYIYNLTNNEIQMNQQRFTNDVQFFPPINSRPNFTLDYSKSFNASKNGLN